VTTKKDLKNRVRGWLPKEPYLPGFHRVADRYKRREQFGTLIFVGLIFVFVALTLFLNPQYVPLFVTIAIAALCFVAAMTLMPKLRQQLIKKVMDHQIKDQEQKPGLYRYRKIAIAAIAIMIAVFPAATSLLPQYTFYVVVTLIIVNLAAGTVLIAGLASSISKKMTLLIVLFFLIGIAASILLRNVNIPFLGG
jgi:uncharacterized membrane-anchored protein